MFARRIRSPSEVPALVYPNSFNTLRLNVIT